MNKALEGMVAAMDAEKYPLPFYEGNGPEVDDFKAMRAALLWLAANVSDEMVDAAEDANVDDVGRSAISAALRAAAGSALEAKP